MNAMKNQKNKDHQNISLLWMSQLQQSSLLQQLLQYAQRSLKDIQHVPAVPLQLVDLHENYLKLQQLPLIKLQTTRLFKDTALDEALRFEQFQRFWGKDILMSAASRKILAPQHEHTNFMNADLKRYQNYLLHVFYLLIALSETKTHAAQFMPAFVQWLNGIQPAYTTSKVTLRVEPHIKSEVLFELPKHAQVEVCAEANPYWRKIRIQDDEQDVYGYIMAAYLKYTYQH